MVRFCGQQRMEIVPTHSKALEYR
eukprot:SAG31_NODE_9005_length_1349_cov_1.406400_1_plen_23_part_10